MIQHASSLFKRIFTRIHSWTDRFRTCVLQKIKGHCSLAERFGSHISVMRRRYPGGPDLATSRKKPGLNHLQIPGAWRSTPVLPWPSESFVWMVTLVTECDWLIFIEPPSPAMSRLIAGFFQSLLGLPQQLRMALVRRIHGASGQQDLGEDGSHSLAIPRNQYTKCI